MQVNLEPWAQDGLELLQLINTPEMKKHLGGPETEAKVLERHERYLRSGDTWQMFRIVVHDGVQSDVVGSVGYWDKVWQGSPINETGWSVLPEFQGHGIATTAVLALVDILRERNNLLPLHAFPSQDNPGSNAICRKAGFELLGVVQFEFPPGHRMLSNDWRRVM